MFYYQQFISWCMTNNMSINKILFFKKDIESQNKMCLFVKQHCNKKKLIDNVACIETTIHELKDLNYNIKNNLRMTICELE